MTAENNVQQILTGFWKADNDFCNKSDLDLFCLYIDKSVDWSKNRAGYIMAEKDGNFIINEPIIIRFVSKWNRLNNWTINMGEKKYFNVVLSKIDCETFPPKQEAELDIFLNKLIIYDKNTITAILHKQHI